MTQKRKFSRLPFHSASTLVFGDSDSIATELIDISFKGALVEAPPNREFPQESLVNLQIKLGGSDITIEMKTEVAHVDAGHIGLKCISIDVDSMTHLRRLLELNLGDPGVLEREVLQLG